MRGDSSLDSSFWKVLSRVPLVFQNVWIYIAKRIAELITLYTSVWKLFKEIPHSKFRRRTAGNLPSVAKNARVAPRQPAVEPSSPEEPDDNVTRACGDLVVVSIMELWRNHHNDLFSLKMSSCSLSPAARMLPLAMWKKCHRRVSATQNPAIKSSWMYETPFKIMYYSASYQNWLN